MISKVIISITTIMMTIVMIAVLKGTTIMI